MSQPWMPLYVGDYLADTGRLSTVEHGAYMLLIMDYWRNGGVPDDDRKLARIARMSDADWVSIRENIAELFQEGWNHKRIDAELAKSASKSEAARASAMRRHYPNDANAMRTHSEGNANDMLSQPQLQSDKKERTEAIASVASADAKTDPIAKPKRAKAKSRIDPQAQPTPQDCDAASSAGLTESLFRAEWRKFRDHHLSKGSLMADWAAAWRTWLGNVPQFQRNITSVQQKDGIGAAIRTIREDRFGLGKPTLELLSLDGGDAGGTPRRMLSAG